MFNIELLPALHGDCIFIEYGTRSEQRRILIDGGPIGAYTSLTSRLNKLPLGDRRVELVVATHVDADHIEGAVRLLAEGTKDFYFDDVWFNGWTHLDDHKGILGPVQGEFLSALISKKIGTARWNRAEPFNSDTIKAGANELPEAGISGMKLTILSPDSKKLSRLRRTWKRDVEKKNFQPGDLDEALRMLRENRRLYPKGLLGGSYQEAGKRFKMDSAVANGSSIAFLAEYWEKKCLFLADAHPDVITTSVKKLIPAGEKRLRVDAVKLSHHGSSANTTPELLELIECKRFLISTNGDIFNHPDPETIDMIVRRAGLGVELYFNYRSDTTIPWADSARQHKEKFTTHYPAHEGGSMVLKL